MRLNKVNAYQTTKFTFEIYTPSGHLRKNRHIFSRYTQSISKSTQLEYLDLRLLATHADLCLDQHICNTLPSYMPPPCICRPRQQQPVLRIFQIQWHRICQIERLSSISIKLKPVHCKDTLISKVLPQSKAGSTLQPKFLESEKVAQLIYHCN